MLICDGQFYIRYAMSFPEHSNKQIEHHPMEIEYSLIEPDIIALTKHLIELTPATRRPSFRRRKGYLIGFALLALGAWLVQGSFFLPIIFLTIAVIAFLLYPIYYDWNLKQTIHKAYTDPKKRASLSTRKLIVTDEYLAEASTIGEAKIKWGAIGNITSTPTHTFITMAGELAAMVIPGKRLSSGNYEEFIEACRRKILDMTTDSPT